MKFGDIEVVELGSGQMSFVGKVRERRRRNPLVGVEEELKVVYRRCDHCRSMSGLPHKLSGERVELRAFYVDGDARDRRKKNVMIVCGSCETELKKLRKENQ